MFILRQPSLKMAALLHKQAKVPFILIIAVPRVTPNIVCQKMNLHVLAALARAL